MGFLGAIALQSEAMARPSSTTSSGKILAAIENKGITTALSDTTCRELST
jgi:hypothetical protein